MLCLLVSVRRMSDGIHEIALLEAVLDFDLPVDRLNWTGELRKLVDAMGIGICKVETALNNIAVPQVKRVPQGVILPLPSIISRQNVVCRNVRAGTSLEQALTQERNRHQGQLSLGSDFASEPGEYFLWSPAGFQSPYLGLNSALAAAMKDSQRAASGYKTFQSPPSPVSSPPAQSFGMFRYSILSTGTMVSGRSNNASFVPASEMESQREATRRAEHHAQVAEQSTTEERTRRLEREDAYRVETDQRQVCDWTRIEAERSRNDTERDRLDRERRCLRRQPREQDSVHTLQLRTPSASHQPWIKSTVQTDSQGSSALDNTNDASNTHAVVPTKSEEVGRPQPEVKLLTGSPGPARRLAEYDYLWDKLAVHEQDIPLPSADFEIPGLRSHGRLLIDQQPVASWLRESVMRLNIQLFFLQGFEMNMYRLEKDGESLWMKGYTRPKVERLYGQLKTEVFRWHPDRLNLRSGVAGVVDEILGKSTVVVAVRTACCAGADG